RIWVSANRDSGRSPPQKAWSEYRPDNGAGDNGSTIPEHDEWDGAGRMMKRKGRRAQRPGNEPGNRAGPSRTGRSLLAQGPNEGGKGDEGERRNKDKASRQWGSKDDLAGDSGITKPQRHDTRRKKRKEQQTNDDQGLASRCPRPRSPEQEAHPGNDQAEGK